LAPVLPDAKVQGFNTPDDEPAVEGAQNGAAGILDEFYLITQFFCFGNHDTGNGI